MRYCLFLPILLSVAAAEEYPHPKGYVCYRAASPITIDGKPDDAAWQAAPWTDYFIDIEGDRRPKPRFRTRAKMLWDDKYFYFAAYLEEPHVWGTLTKHDSVIFHDNDFEIFLDPDSNNHKYFEFEINALNTGWDLFLPKPYKDGGKADNGWEVPGLRTAVHIDGTLNDSRDTDLGWSVEIAMPWEAFRQGAPHLPPLDGDAWRVSFSRVEWEHVVVNGKYEKVKGKREDNWVWSPQYAINMHRPEHWGYVQFSTGDPGTVAFRPDPTHTTRMRLHAVYYAQQEYFKQHKRYEENPQLPGGVSFHITGDGFEARAGGLVIRQDSLIVPER